MSFEHFTRLWSLLSSSDQWLIVGVFLFMHTQIHTLQSVGIPVPNSLSCHPFLFSEVFSLGNSDTTNISERNKDFDISFFTRCKKKCQMPEKVCFRDVPAGILDTLLSVSGAHPSSEIWNLRVPIKLVGHFKDQQKTGQTGPLLVDGNINIFICRDQYDKLKKVELWFDQRSHSWKITASSMEPGQLLEGPFRLFVSCREK